MLLMLGTRSVARFVTLSGECGSGRRLRRRSQRHELAHKPRKDVGREHRRNGRAAVCELRYLTAYECGEGTVKLGRTHTAPDMSGLIAVPGRGKLRALSSLRACVR